MELWYSLFLCRRAGRRTHDSGQCNTVCSSYVSSSQDPQRVAALRMRLVEICASRRSSPFGSAGVESIARK